MPRNTPAMGSETGATACHFARFLTSHFPAVERNCNCQPSDRRGETCEQRKSDITPASVLTVDGMYNSEWDAGAGNMMVFRTLLGFNGCDGMVESSSRGVEGSSCGFSASSGGCFSAKSSSRRESTCLLAGFG